VSQKPYLKDEKVSFKAVLGENLGICPPFGSDLKPCFLCQLHGHCYGVASFFQLTPLAFPNIFWVFVPTSYHLQPL